MPLLCLCVHELPLCTGWSTLTLNSKPFATWLLLLPTTCPILLSRTTLCCSCHSTCFLVPSALGTLFLLLWIPPPPCLLLPKHPHCKCLVFLQKPSFKVTPSWRPPRGPLSTGDLFFLCSPTTLCSHMWGTVLTPFAGSLLFLLDSVFQGRNQNLSHNGISESTSLNFNTW